MRLLSAPVVTLLLTAAAACSKDHEPNFSTTEGTASGTMTDPQTATPTGEDSVADTGGLTTIVCGDEICKSDQICVQPHEDCQLGQEQGCPGDSTSSVTESPPDVPCWNVVAPPSGCVSTHGCDRDDPDFESCITNGSICDCGPHTFSCGLVDEWHFDCGFDDCCNDECT